MPFAGYKDFDACVNDHIKKGKNRTSATNICGYLQAVAEHGKKPNNKESEKSKTKSKNKGK